MLLLSNDQVRDILSMDDALQAVETAFTEAARPGSNNLLRRRMFLDTQRFNILGGVLIPSQRAVVKVYGGGQFWTMLFAADGALLATIESRFASLYRTGAATGVATRHLAREDSRTVGIIGTGVQATAQLEALARVLPLESISAWSPTPENRERFAAAMTNTLGIDVRVCADAESTVRDADVVVTATKAFDPVLRGDWLAPGTHVNLMGANQIHRREAHPDVFARSALVTVDDLAQAEIESGDLLGALDAAALRWHDIVEITDIVTGTAPGRTSADQITVFKSLGVGTEDVAVASLIYDRAREQGIGLTA